MIEKTSQKPIYLAMEDAKPASAIIQMIRKYPNLETLRVAKPPGKLTVFMLEREPSVIVVDSRISPPLVSKAKSRVPELGVIIVAPRSEINIQPIDQRRRVRFLSYDCAQYEVHNLLDHLINDSKVYDKHAISPVSDMLAVLCLGAHRGNLEIRDKTTNLNGTITISNGSVISASFREIHGAEAIEIMKRWHDCDFHWNHLLEGFEEDNFLEDVSLSLLAEASDLVSGERGLIEATDTSMFPMSFDSNVDFDSDASDAESQNFFSGNLLNSKLGDRAISPASSLASQNKEHSNQIAPPIEQKSNIKNLDNRTETEYTGDEVLSSFNPRSDSQVTSNSQADGLKPKQLNPKIGANMASNATEILQELTSIAGFIAGAVVDSDSGMTLAKLSNSMSFDIDVAAATNTEVIKAKLRAAKALKLDDNIEDILITLTNQYHLLRPLEEYPSIFFYVALDREQANLAMARIKLKTVGSKIKL